MVSPLARPCDTPNTTIATSSAYVRLLLIPAILLSPAAKRIIHRLRRFHRLKCSSLEICVICEICGSKSSMKGKPKKSPREKDLTSRYLSGGLDEDRVDQQQRFSDRSKHAVRDKTQRTSDLRAAEIDHGGDIDALPTG